MAAGSFLDRRGARLLALGVCAASLGLLGWLQRGNLFASDTAVRDPVALCIAERVTGIDRLLEEGTISSEQAALFRTRAEALCVAQLGNANLPAGESVRR